MHWLPGLMSHAPNVFRWWKYIIYYRGRKPARRKQSSDCRPELRNGGPNSGDFVSEGVQWLYINGADDATVPADQAADGAFGLT